MSFVDTLMVGRLGNDALAGIAIGSTVFHFVLVMLGGVLYGVGPIVSQAFGADDPETAARAARQSLWMGVLLFLPAFLLYWNAYPLLILLGQSEQTALDSSAYLRAVSWGLLPALWVIGLRGLLEGQSNTRPIMLISFVCVFFNVSLNWIFMFGKFGFPAMGLVGTGYATSIVYGLVFVMLAAYVHFRYPDLHVFTRIRTPDMKMMGELTRVGGPIALTIGFEVSMFGAAALAMGTLGKFELAAHQIALQTASISFMIPLGLAIATSVRVGQAIGRKSSSEAEIAGRVGMLTCMGVMCISGLTFWCFPRLIIGAYIDIQDPANLHVVKFATTFLAIAAIFQIVDGLQVSASAALRGLKDTKAAMYLTLISYWGVGVTSGVLLCYQLGFEGAGLWIGMTLGLATAAILLSIRFQSKVRSIKFE
jgi:MATE family multidrug resistance protein